MNEEPRHDGEGSFIDRLSRAVGADVDPRVELEAGGDAEAPGGTGSGTSGVVARMRERPSLSSRYRLEGEIARGGMGAILDVWDEDLRRRLAMKVALGGGKGSSGAASELDPRLLSRFLEEAQVTGQLEHPGIVPVHELGIDDNGVVFFTKQLVRGSDLEKVFGLVPEGTDGWSVTRALGVLLKVCEAMAFAHSKGVIHRDLKPANVMVGDFGEVYVMDWGLVRVRGGEDRHDVRVAAEGGVDTDVRTDSTGGASDALYTMDGDVLGTPAYMSPEQARGDIEHLDERTDVYAVGAMLYHLLAGVAPYNLPGMPKLGGLETLKALRKGPPPALAQLASDAPAELVAIGEKAMAREPDERYADMLGLAEDLRAYLENRVVQAYQTGAVAEARKWVRRNRPLAASIAAGLLALVGGLVASLYLKAQSDENAEQASRQASIAREVADFMNDDLLAAIAPGQQGIDVTVREVLAISSSRLDGRFDDEPLVEAELRRTIGTSFDRLGDYELARDHLVRAHELFAREQGERSEAALSTALLVGFVWNSLGRFDEALEHFAGLIETCGAELGPNARQTLAARAGIAETHWLMGSLDRSLELYDELEQVLRGALGDRHELTLAVFTGHASVLHRLGHLDRAEALQAEALEALRATVGEGHPQSLNAADALGEIYVAQGRSAEAEALLLATQKTREEVLGPDHPSTANGLGQVGTHYFVQGRYADAEEQYARGYEMLRRSLGSEHRLTLQMANNLAGAMSSLGRLDEALELRDTALEAQRRTLGDEHPHTIMAMGNRATLLKILGRFDEAEAGYLENIALRERVFGADHPDTLTANENLSGLWLTQSRYAESIELSEQVLAGRQRVLGPEHPAVARTFYNLGIAEVSTGDRDAARDRFEQAFTVGSAAGAVDVATYAQSQLAELSHADGDELAAKASYLEAAAARRAFGIEDAAVAEWLHEAGRCAHRLDEYDESVRHFEAALALRRELFGSEDTTTLRTMIAQSRVLQDAERFEEAEERALEVHQRLLEREGEGAREVGQARGLLVQLYEAWGRPEEADRWRQ